MSRRVLVFWGTALGVAAGIAAAAALFLPYEALRLQTLEERERAWLLTVWVAGVFAILFGITAVLGGFGGIGAREVVEAGSVRGALESHHSARRAAGAPGLHGHFGWWLIATGALLVGIYFAAWLAWR